MRFQFLASILALTIIFLAQFSVGLEIFYSSLCQSGHVTPNSGLVRALTARGHQVDLYMADKCCDAVAHRFRGHRDCFYTEGLVPSFDLPEEGSTFKLFVSFADLLATNATFKAYQETSEFIKARHYDVVVYDFPVFGTIFGAKVNNVPVVVNYIGPVFGSRKEESFMDLDVDTMIYFHSGHFFPVMVQKFCTALLFTVYHHAISTLIFKYMQQIHEENNWPTDYLADENSGFLGVSYSFRHAVAISNGSPHTALYDTEFMNRTDHNIYSVGFVPDENYFRTIPDDVENFLSEGEKPVVFISLGTLVHITNTSLDAMYGSISGQSEYKFIWALTKKNFDYLSNVEMGKRKSPNLLIGTKLPQLSILMRENLKVFITHAGGNSMQEGIYSQTPMIVFPSTGDQPLNAKMMLRRKIALDIPKFAFEHLKERLDELLVPDVYSAMQKRLKFMNKTMTSLGGFKRAVEIVEQTGRGELKVKSTPASWYLRNGVYFLYFEIFKMIVFVGVACGSIILSMRYFAKKYFRKQKTE
ncbi:UDP-glucuronosyltransferase 2B17-like [Convolutriloba macropyga]|uniref:UDP-glucuronosyltransferase 2B17-like n=1 Tax=Convolutriloba macropyga TaxID=536237 RepID=UPI003F5219AD